jgi:serpin B
MLCWTDNRAVAAPDLTALVSSNTDFALSLYGQLRTNDGNLFFSPYSISTCLGMTYAGARGETALQMARALDFSTNQDRVGAAFGALQTELDKLQGDAGIEFTLANGLWTQQGVPFLPDFLGNATSNYQAVLNQVNFVTQADSVTGEINQWVAQKTQGIIVNLLGPGMVNAQTRLVLVNAIYFKGAWASQFSTNATTVQPFYVSSNQTVNVSLMHQTNSVGYYQNNSFQAVELPYRGTNATMVILLPGDPGGLAQLEASLTPQELAQVLTNMEMGAQPVEVFLPKFSLQATENLIPDLENLGMTDAFTGGVADFSGMDGARDFSIGVVVHKAFVDVDETGTVAAAATGIVVGVAVAPPTPPVFRADHPFLFMIRDTLSGSILFVGRVSDPPAANGSATASNNAAFPAASYGGLFYDTNGIALQSSGSLSFSVGVTGKFTGQLAPAGQTYDFKGQFFPQATSATVTIVRPRLPELAVTLQVPDSGGAVAGLVSDGAWTAEITCEQTSLGYSAAHPAPQAGNYTMTLLGTSDGTLSPGYGSYARVTVAPNGTIGLTGLLSDGTVISQTAPLGANGCWPLHVSLYAGRGSLLGWINFTNLPASRLNGTASWIKTGAYGPYYAHGFTNEVTALGSLIHR